MIDFENKEVLKLRPADDEDFSKYVSPMFVEGEYIIQAFRSIRDGIIFTNKRMIAINIQGVTGI